MGHQQALELVALKQTSLLFLWSLGTEKYETNQLQAADGFRLLCQYQVLHPAFSSQVVFPLSEHGKEVCYLPKQKYQLLSCLAAR